MFDLFKSTSIDAIKGPVTRLFTGGFSKMGTVERAADTRSEKELLENIDYYAEKVPEIKGFKEALKTMDKKHLGLVSDICELASHIEMLPTMIDMKKPINGKSLIQVLFEQLPKASKENPTSLDFAQEVINHTDSTTSKYFLANFVGGIMHNHNLSEHFVAAKGFIKDLAESTLNVGYTADFKPQANFMNMIKVIINPKADYEKIALLPRISKTVDEISDKDHAVCIDKILYSKTPVSRIEQNLEHLTNVERQLETQGKQVDVADFLTDTLTMAKSQ